MQDNYPLRARISTTLKSPPFTEQQLNVSLSGSLADLGLTVQAQGLLNATLDGNFELLAADLPLSVTLNYQPITWPMPDDEAPLQISAGALSASGNLQQLTFELDGGIASSKLPLINLRAKGQYQLAESTLILNSYIADTLGGSIIGNGNVTLAMPINWQTTLTLNSIQPGLFWPELNNELSGELNGKLSNQGTLGKDGSWQTALTELAITGSLRDEKVNISGDVSASFAQPSGAYQFNSKQLLLQHGNNQISVSGSLAKQWQLDAKVAIADLASSVPDASGVINADITIRGEQQQPDIYVMPTAAWQH
jgi:translocation and assembly module TamB